jgi:CheY-like chemotaxis protein
VIGKILIVEDDPFKLKRLDEAIQSIVKDAKILNARSVNSGLEQIEEHAPNLILLDMSLTTFDIGPEEPGGRPQNFGGLEVLRQMDRASLKIPTIVITQHERFQIGNTEVKLESLLTNLMREHPDVVKGLIYYNSSQSRWRILLRRIVNEIVRSGKSAK